METIAGTDAHKGGRLPFRARIFDYLALTGFAINMLVVALIVGHWALH